MAGENNPERCLGRLGIYQLPHEPNNQPNVWAGRNGLKMLTSRAKKKSCVANSAGDLFRRSSDRFKFKQPPTRGWNHHFESPGGCFKNLQGFPSCGIEKSNSRENPKWVPFHPKSTVRCFCCSRCKGLILRREQPAPFWEWCFFGRFHGPNSKDSWTFAC